MPCSATNNLVLAKAIASCIYTYMQWLVSKEPVLPCDSHVTVGVVLDSDHAFSVLDMGPAADSKQVSQLKLLCNNDTIALVGETVLAV